MATTVTVFEHETRLFTWDDSDVATLDRVRRAIGVDVVRPTVYQGQRAIQATHYVGVIRLGKHIIQVLPKIYHSNESVDERRRAREATRNLLVLLACAHQVPIHAHALAPLLEQDLDWFEILTRLFASNLMEEWQRGAFRTYRVVDDDIPLLKGKWRVVDQIRRPERKHIFAVSYDELTADNMLNRVFRFVVERLWHLTRDSHNRRTLDILRQWMEEVTLEPSITVADAGRITLTRLNQRYAPLLHLACLFLDQSVLQLTAGDVSTFTFVFDMNRLFEAFVISTISRHRREILPSSLRDCEILPQSRGAARYLARRGDTPVFRLRPDLAFRSGGHFPLLVDAKYKRLNQADARFSVSTDDFYQMHAYVHRFQCPRVVLLYPQTADQPEPLRARFVLEGHDSIIQIATIDLRLDLTNWHAHRQLVQNLSTIFGGEGKYGEREDHELAHRAPGMAEQEQ